MPYVYFCPPIPQLFSKREKRISYLNNLIYEHHPHTRPEKPDFN